MTQDEIIEMARFAGIRIDSFGFQNGFIEEFEAFANLVAAKEQKKWQDQTAVEIHEALLEERERIHKAKAQLEQEPWCMKMNGCKTNCEDCPDEPPDICCQQYDTCLKPCTPRGVHLAQRTWVGLAAEDRLCAKYMQDAPDGIDAVIDYIEAKLKELNT